MAGARHRDRRHAGKQGEQVHVVVGHHVHDALLEHVRRRLVVPRRDTFSEVTVLVVHRRTVSRKDSAVRANFARPAA